MARRLLYVKDRHIWGGTARCSSHLSDGPVDADVELRLGGFPNSTAAEPVHLQWWAPRKSPTAYDPLKSPVGCSIHRSVLSAYPAHTDADFNGGNVRVSEAGEAVIRVRAPATYLLWRFVSVPHIHLRLCEGASNIKFSWDAVMMAGVDLWATSHGPHDIKVLSAGPYAGQGAAAPGASSSGHAPVGVITGVVDAPQASSSTLPAGTTMEPFTTAAAQSTAATTEPTTTATLPATTTVTATTVLPAVISTRPASAERSMQISAARNALDLKALEFSPVYRCLLEQKFFDHFSTDCTQSCPMNSAVSHGQCVRAETADPRAQVETTWQLGIECGGPCWEDGTMNSTLHGARLSIAGHLDIPFQEVEVTLGLAASTSRRLAATHTAYMTAKVSSNRISEIQSNTLLGSFAQDAASMSSLLGLRVLTVASGTPPAQPSSPVNMGQGSDPYVPAYADVERTAGPRGRATPVTSPVGFLPTEAIIGIAVGVVVLAAVVGVLIWRRQRQRRAAAGAQQPKAVAGKTAGADTTPPAEKEDV